MFFFVNNLTNKIKIHEIKKQHEIEKIYLETLLYLKDFNIKEESTDN